MMDDKPLHNPQNGIHWASVFQIGFSLVGMLIFWSLAMVLAMMVLNSVLTSGDLSAAADSVSLLLMAAGFGFTGFLLLPSAGFAFLRLINRPVPVRFQIRRPGWVILGALVLVGVGYLTAENTFLTWAVLPFIHVVTIGFSVLWVVALGIRGLPIGSAQRSWGVFGSGMVLAPVLSILLEVIVIVGISILGVSYLARDPGFAQDLAQITDRFMANPSQPPDAILEFLEPYWAQPATLYAVLLVVAVLVPLIEELLKPVGVWLLAWKDLTPAQGFSAGILSGAGFALFETFTLSASSGEEWSLIALARIGTSIIHIVTTGLTGWGLALAWQENRYVRLGLAYIAAVSIHALWNGLVVMTVLGEFWPNPGDLPAGLLSIQSVAPFGFILLLVGGFVLLLGCNRALRRAIIPPAKPVELD